jgi:hypothetical protein
MLLWLFGISLSDWQRGTGCAMAEMCHQARSQKNVAKGEMAEMFLVGE